MNEIELTTEQESIAQTMLKHRGNLNLVSREPHITHNAMALRKYVQSNPEIRHRYQELLSYELQDQQLHISERILRMAELQDKAYGDIENNIPCDPKMAIDISKHISELIKESKGINVSEDSSLLITSKESVTELLQQFLDT